MKKFVYIDRVRVYDDVVFTREEVDKWKRHVIRNMMPMFEEFRKRINPVSEIRITWSSSLFDEVFVDAVIGLRKITQSENNQVQAPNAFKVISYVAYWFLRHKPISVNHSVNKPIEEVQFILDEELSPEEAENKRQEHIWRLKHINEIIAANFVLNYIFDFHEVLCGEQRCHEIKCAEVEFCFDSFIEMFDVMRSKLIYYFAYRTLAPKIIEHILEGYTMHPAWKLTGEHWKNAKEESIAP